MTAEPTLTIELVEGGGPLEVTLPADVVGFLVSRRIVDAISLGPQRWWLSPRTKVGSVHVAGVTVRVTPKLPIEQIVFLLGYATDPGWLSGPVEFAPHHEFVDAMADAFARQATNALQRGAIQGYRETEADLQVLRGRMREQEQLRRRFGMALPLLVRYDEYTVDIAENRIIRAATEALLALTGLRPATVAALRSLRTNLADVAVLPRGARCPGGNRPD
ncbi:MAG: 5-methylcytosine restriction system specificity protein McrC [Acidimicrobiales bacterium]